VLARQLFDPPGQLGAAAADHYNPDGLPFTDLRVELSAPTVLEVEGVEVLQELSHEGLY
jgi:hypothetical protein